MARASGDKTHQFITHVLLGREKQDIPVERSQSICVCVCVCGKGGGCYAAAPYIPEVAVFP